MSHDEKGRKFQITINNPLSHGLSRDEILTKLNSFHSNYYCLVDEIGRDNNTPHTHIFIYVNNTIRFSTLKNTFPSAHIEKANGSVTSNIDYLMKRGKWEETEKADTTVKGSFYEQGVIPIERETSGKVGLPELIECINDGLSIGDILKLHPQYGFKIKEIELLRETLLSEKYSKEKRDITVTYIYGVHNVGKTQSIYDSFLPKDVCRISTYPTKGVKYDAYSGQDVLVFDNFDSEIPLQELVEIMKGFPLKLSARYSDKTACFTKIYILSNVNIMDTYFKERIENLPLWETYYDCIDHIVHQLSSNQKILIPKETNYENR